MNGFEFNKIFAAILVAGITAMTCAMISNGVVSADEVAAHGSEEVAESAAAAAPQGPEPIEELLASADLARGQGMTKACAACHTFDKGGANGVGPNLWNIMTRGKAAASGYTYSDSMKEAGGTWGYDDMNHFLWKPKSLVAGTKMTFAGIKKPEDRAAVIAYLRTLADSPPALP